MLTNFPADVLLTEKETKILLRAIHSRDSRLVTATIIGVPRIFDELHRIISALPKIMMHNESNHQEASQDCGPSRRDRHSHVLSDEHGALDLSIKNLRKRLRPRDFYKPEGSIRSDESFHVLNPTLSPIIHSQFSPPNSSTGCSNQDVQGSMNNDNLMEIRAAVQSPAFNFNSPFYSVAGETKEEKERRTQHSQPNSPATGSDVNCEKKKVTKLYQFPSKRPIKCDICFKVVRADNFRVHQRSHTGEKPYRCPICPFRSANPSSMPKHLKLHDKGRMIFYCDNCTYSTIYKSNLAAHMRTNHSELTQNSTIDTDNKELSEMRLECIQCGGEFSTQEQKMSHEAVCLSTPVDFSTCKSECSQSTGPHNSRNYFHSDERNDSSSPISVTSLHEQSVHGAPDLR